MQVELTQMQVELTPEQLDLLIGLLANQQCRVGDRDFPTVAALAASTFSTLVAARNTMNGESE